MPFPQTSKRVRGFRTAEPHKRLFESECLNSRGHRKELLRYNLSQELAQDLEQL